MGNSKQQTWRRAQSERKIDESSKPGLSRSPGGPMILKEKPELVEPVSNEVPKYRKYISTEFCFTV